MKSCGRRGPDCSLYFPFIRFIQSMTLGLSGPMPAVGFGRRDDCVERTNLVADGCPSPQQVLDSFQVVVLTRVHQGRPLLLIRHVQVGPGLQEPGTHTHTHTCMSLYEFL